MLPLEQAVTARESTRACFGMSVIFTPKRRHRVIASTGYQRINKLQRAVLSTRLTDFLRTRSNKPDHFLLFRAISEQHTTTITINRSKIYFYLRIHWIKLSYWDCHCLQQQCKGTFVAGVSHWGWTLALIYASASFRAIAPSTSRQSVNTHIRCVRV